VPARRAQHAGGFEETGNVDIAEEIANIVVSRGLDQLGRRAHLDQAAIFHDADTAANLDGLFNIVK
jgi:hypothetical protein